MWASHPRGSVGRVDTADGAAAPTWAGRPGPSERTLSFSHWRPVMAMLPTRRNSGRSMTLVNPSREFEDIYDRMGQLMNMAFGSLASVAVPDLPWAPAADVSETDDAYVVRV